ncbi:hypothetical protein C8Q77DRAFT_1049115, partial [Trametes polyzona]
LSPPSTMSASVDVLPHRPSLLDRRASSNLPDLPDRLSVSALVGPAAQSASGAPFARGAFRKPSATFLPFVPLTPIMASPLLTPEIAHAATPAAVLETAARQPMSGHDPPQEQQDYLSHHASPPNPTWTTSPPTPPPKLASPTRITPSPTSSPVRVNRGRSKSHSRSSRSRSSSRSRPGPRPASLASYTPTPLSRSYSPSSPLAAARPLAASSADDTAARRLSLPADLTKPLPPRPSSATDGAPAAMAPAPSTSRSVSVIDDADGPESEALLPSLSRRAPGTRQREDSSACMPASQSSEMSPSRGRAKKLFSLDDDEVEGDVSDSEERRRGASGRAERKVRETATAPAAPMLEEQAVDPEQEKTRAERVRRYHALMELLTTEVGYLLDLRTLVTVYLDQLLLLSTPSPSIGTFVPLGPMGLPTPPLTQPLCLGVPLPSSGRSMSTLSALSIPSIFPSSRSSFLNSTPAPSPSPSTADFLSSVTFDKEAEEDASRGRTRQSSGTSTSAESASRERDKEREREKENMDRVHPLKPSKSSRQQTSVLAEKEVRAVYRNARELLVFHERFVGELHAAVGLVGIGMMFSGDEAWLNDMRGDGECVVADLVEHAVETVANKFINEAASFGIYETFCPGHAAATDLVRRAQDRWPAVWEAYEQRCALLLTRNPDFAHPHQRGRSDDSTDGAPSAFPAFDEGGLEADAHLRKKRRHSTPTLSLPPSVASVHRAGAPPSQLPFPSAPSPTSSTLPPPIPSPSERRLRSAGPKLKFMDYLIKPVQRICKYPLLLDQLRPKRRESFTVRQAAADEAVRRAGEAMRRVVSRVNRASEKEAHNLRSALIASRIAFAHSPAPAQGSSTPSSAPSAYAGPAPPTPSSSSASSSSHGHGTSTSAAASPSSGSAGSCASSPAATIPAGSSSSGSAPASLPPLAVPSPRPTALTAEFVSSLGPCMLAGALDVIQHPAHRAKYLGAFLYAGGYCILVKVTKGGRVYEPRHWFAFGAVEVVDVEEDDPSFPYSFHVLAHGHDLQFGAACAQEKAIWLAAINDALKTKPAWTNEPLSSFQADEKTPLSAADDSAPPQESPSGLPAIQSLSDLEKQADGAPAEAAPAATTPSKGQLKYSRTLSRLDSTALRQDSHPPIATISAALSRRSSTASVKAFFAPFDSARPARPSAQVRAQVEHGLHDLLSEACVGARAQAQMRGEELFQVRPPLVLGKRQGSGIPRSNSGISIANAMGLTAAKRRYDSVLVSRRKASLDGVPDVPVPGESASASPSSSGQGTEAVNSANASPASAATASSLAGRTKSLAVRRHKKQPASIAPAISTAIAQFNTNAEAQRRGSVVRSPEALSLDSPPATSQCSSSASSHPGSVLPSPTEASPLPIPVPGLSPNGTLRQSDILQVHVEDTKPKRSRSMVSHVRNIFHGQRRELSPSVSSSSEFGHSAAPPPHVPESPSGEYPSGIVQWLRRTSIRRRDSGSSSSRSADDYHHAGRRPLPTRSSTDGVSRHPGAHDPSLHIPQGSPRRVAFMSPGESTTAPPKRRRSLFVPSSRSRDRTLAAARDDAPDGSPATSASTSLSSHRSIKSFFLFQRSNSFTPLG